MITANTNVKVFFDSRSAARATGKQVKDVGSFAPKGERWYIDSVAQVLDVPKKPALKQDVVLQSIFNAAAKHLLTQNKQSIMKGKTFCAYRGGKNLMCAAGPFIANAYYDPAIEGNVITDAPVKDVLKASGFPVDNAKAMQILRRLQMIHDGRKDHIVKWPSKLIELARQFELSHAVVDQFKKD